MEKPGKMEPLMDEVLQLIRIFAKSIQTSERRRDSMKNGRVQESSDDPEPWLLDPWMFGVERLAFEVQPPAGPVKYGKGARKK